MHETMTLGELRRLMREDASMNPAMPSTRLLMRTYRLGGWLFKRRKERAGLARLWFRMWYVPLVMVHHMMSTVVGCDLPFSTRIGRRVTFVHGFHGVFFSTQAVIGDDCILLQQVTIGSNNHTAASPGAPRIGNRVFIGVGAKVIGPVTVGDDARIGANAIVVTDVPAGATAISPKAQIRLAKPAVGSGASG